MYVVRVQDQYKFVYEAAAAARSLDLSQILSTNAYSEDPSAADGGADNPIYANSPQFDGADGVANAEQNIYANSVVVESDVNLYENYTGTHRNTSP